MTVAKADIQATVERLLTASGVTQPPVPVERIARYLDAQLRYEPFEGELSGLLYQENGQIIVGVNALHPKSRQRFTIAHELGHLVLHNRNKLHVDRNFRVHLRDTRSSQAVDSAEIAANAFAAELLMPTALLRHDLEGYAVDYEDDELLHSLAMRYKISLQAMIFRLVNLGFMEDVTAFRP
jgi:Zn-dependent peptidase ImmA (M78 family)